MSRTKGEETTMGSLLLWRHNDPLDPGFQSAERSRAERSISARVPPGLTLSAEAAAALQIQILKLRKEIRTNVVSALNEGGIAVNGTSTGRSVDSLNLSTKDGLRICMFMQNTLTRLLRLPLVSVALVQGKALGGGAEVTTACDFRLMTSGSEIRFVHKHMGLTPGWGGATRLIKLIGYRNALKLLSSAQPVDPATGLKIGLADELLTSTDGDSCLEEVENWLNQYTNGSSQVIRAIKNVVVSGRELSQEESLKNEKSIFGTLWGSPANLKALAQKIKRN
ncbi:hypothetical protein scyTo_0005919 [Scyliorhinus torazame]|uniref:Ethylmalonyl-CoA decarboxylase n=1 Tax=Scyliorhinus torazame TaxID=75743 RepID=A0A401PE42_SCYTO|nr:hypothetical protein [Scyliorhinus torazame]